ncbi:hypothetical protein F383_14098 [Gossypium arboreum]|uniref:Uncharacterized protein n=1 Tax=Gossypium arboreum TaxID=29729 RepID=A0A0B0PWA9_GOSAR|nr:hypothetical protein F383_14098 [Gossypium arboreum]
MSRTWSYTGSHLSMSMPCPRHSLTLTHLVADAMSQTWSYNGSQNVADACPRHVLH